MGSAWSSDGDSASVNNDTPVQEIVNVSGAWTYNRHARGWVPAASSDQPQQQQAVEVPAPALNIKAAKLLKAPATIHKNSIKLVQESQSHLSFLQFTFDSTSQIQIVAHVDAEDKTADAGVPKFISHYPDWPCTTTHSTGLNQLYSSPLPIDTQIFGPDQWDECLTAKRFPIVIELVAEVEGIRHAQATYLSLKEQTAGGIGVFMLHQRIAYGERVFYLEEIYGLDAYQDKESNNETNKDCIICLTEARTTAVLPCRHLCLCSSCAGLVRIQSNRCPICRQNVTGLLQLNLTS